MIRRIGFDSLADSRWKNGAGSKRDIALGQHPDGTMAWMFGSADIERDAPFSVFPGAQRWFSVVSDGQVALDIGQPPAAVQTTLLDRHSAPWQFAGDLPTRCRLLSDPVRVFNVMTAGLAGGVRVARHSATTLLTLLTRADQVALVFVESGAARCTASGDDIGGTRDTVIDLAALDSLLVTDGNYALQVAPADEGRLIVATIDL